MNIWEQKNLFQRNKLAQRWSFHSIYEAWAAHEMRKGVVQLYIKNNEVIFSLAWNIIFSDNWKVLVLKFLEMKNMVFLSQKVDGNMIFNDYWNVLVLIFPEMGNTVFSLAKKLIERLYLLITEKVLFWTLRWWEMQSFFESRSWWKDDIFWLLRSSCFELFGDRKYGLFWVKKLMKRWYLLGLFGLSMIFQDLENMFFHTVFVVSPLVILIGCMIFLLPFRNVIMIFWNEIKEIISTLSFLWPMI